ncbi:MAG: dTDP-4-dehydrorhamnose 3,5-epimerase family protein [bacterium]|nr:dTDP-4-dehydrorhamnose 3,5-epimerase family protein [bacterium]
MISVSKTRLDGVLKIQCEIHRDHRGFYAEGYNEKIYREHGISTRPVEWNFTSSPKNALRGLHGDSQNWKLVFCSHGKVYFVVLNYNEASPQYGHWQHFILTPEDCLQILVPPKFGIGHLVLSDLALFHYGQSVGYVGMENQFVIKWNDPRFNISWPVTKGLLLSERDGG